MESQLTQAAHFRSDAGDEDALRADPKNDPWEWYE